MWIRSVTEFDLEAIRALLKRTWHATYDDIYGVDRVDAITDDWHSIDALRTQLDKPYSEFVMADDGVRVLGVAFASMVEDGISQLHQLYIDPEAQNRGTGTALLLEVENAFPSASTLRLEVEAANSRAIAFYTKRGFHEVGRTNHASSRQSGTTALIMAKALQWQ